jgi:hypothetical protein
MSRHVKLSRGAEAVLLPLKIAMSCALVGDKGAGTRLYYKGRDVYFLLVTETPEVVVERIDAAIAEEEQGPGVEFPEPLEGFILPGIEENEGCWLTFDRIFTTKEELLAAAAALIKVAMES